MVETSASTSTISTMQEYIVLKTLPVHVAARYFTVWSYGIVVLSLILPQISKYINLLFLTTFVLILSLLISYVSPGYIKYYDPYGKTTNITGNAKYFIDILFHIIPFGVVYVLHYDTYRIRPYDMSFVNTLLLMLINIIIFDAKKTYDLSDNIIVAGFVLSCIVYHVLVI